MNDNFYTGLFTFIGAGLVVWLYIRFFLAVIRIERHTKVSSEANAKAVEYLQHILYKPQIGTGHGA